MHEPRPFPSFQELRARIFGAYARGDYAAALTLLDSEAEAFSDFRFRLDFWRACLQSVSGDGPGAVQTLRAAIASGIWWAPDKLKNEPDFAPIRESPEYADLIAQLSKIHETSTAGGKSSIYLETHDPLAPYIVNLHWRTGNLEEYRGYYEDYCRNSGQNMCFVQSSQPAGSHEFCWDDFETARRDIHQAIAELGIEVSAYWGASQGARIAYQLAAAEGKDFLGVMPALKIDHLLAAPDAAMRIDLIVGDADPYFAAARDFADAALAAGNRVRVQLVPGLGHDMPADLDQRLVELQNN